MVAAALALAIGVPGAAQAQQIPGPQIGQRAPEILAKGLDGRPVSLGDFRGKVLVLNFWATWCGPCRLETPDMIRSYAKLSGADVAFLGVDSTEKAPIIHSFISAKGLPYPVAIDDDHATSVAYDVRGIPTTYVIDGTGVVRARFVDVISVGQLAAFVSAAKAGRNGTITSPVQAKIDATLDPSRFTYPADYEGVLRTVKASTDAINSSNKLLGGADPAKGEVTDYLKIRAGQAALEKSAIAALTRVAKSDADHALLDRLQGDYATNSENWDDAIAAYQKALALNGKDQDALSGLAFAYYEKKDWKNEIAAYERLAVLSPDPDTDISIGKAYLQLKDYPNAIAAERKGVALAERNFAHKKDADTTLYGSYAWLYLGRAYVEAGDTANAHKAFLNAMHYAQQMAPKSANYGRYVELAQEADVALGLDNSGKTVVSLAPWTGADLPGSLASTVKYRLVLAAKPGSTVQLSAMGLAKGWLASFCTDRLCSPMQRTVNMPPSGVKIFEFQLIPNDPHAAKHTTVRVRATGGGGNATTSSVVASR
ncbi:MAG: hypothetical protein NVSMB31_08810 [Vulcanimicrobiaceae bacterium]